MDIPILHAPKIPANNQPAPRRCAAEVDDAERAQDAELLIRVRMLGWSPAALAADLEQIEQATGYPLRIILRALRRHLAGAVEDAA